MAINLEKGQKVELKKGMKKVVVGLGWDTNKYDGAEDFDLDACALLKTDETWNDENHFVYFNNKVGGKGTVVHAGDNLTGEGSGDDETIEIDVEMLPQDIKEIQFHIAIYDSESRKQNFGQIGNAFCRVVADGEELCRYDLGEDYSINTRMYMGRLYKHNGEWKFSAEGIGATGGIKEVIA